MPEAVVDSHAIALDALFERLHSIPSGLSDEEAARRLRESGANRIEEAQPVSPLRVLIAQFRSVVVALLIAATAISALMGDVFEALAIACVLFINTAIGFGTELQARRAISSLIRLQTARALVLRSGRLLDLDAGGIVSGDVIEIDGGQRVPADGRIIESHDLRVDEAILTGESLPVDKRVETLPLETALADRRNMVLMGTIALAGTARILVLETGARTELGRIGRLMRAIPEEPTPLERHLDTLGRRLVWLTLAIAGVVVALGWRRGEALETVLNTGLALAVAAVPEALPAVATIALAVGVRRMARRRALIRRLPAVEALGSTTVICTDKTRTLTSGEMTAAQVWTPEAGGWTLEPIEGRTPPESVRHALAIAARASRERGGTAGEEGIGDPVDAAMLRAARSIGVESTLVPEQPLVWIPFSSGRKLTAAIVGKGPFTAFVKGAPRRIVNLCVTTSDGRRCDETTRRELLEMNERLAGAGLRVLAVATGPIGEASEAALSDLVFVGFIGLLDPPAAGVADTIRRLRTAGLRTVMLTGDQRRTAEAVGRMLGLLSEQASAVDGRELDAMTADMLASRIADTGAFSRVTPEHKLIIVAALQQRGEVVAMLGDGVNDAAALKKADVGVAMGRRGTDVAKEAAAIVLQDDRFETIAVAVEEGRIVSDNIRKFVFYLFSCNLAEVLVVLLAGLIGSPPPLRPLQLLWMNLVTDTFPALALAFEPGEAGIMTRPPRDPKEAILSRAFLVEVLLYGGLIAIVSLAVFLRVLATRPEAAQTSAFMTLALAQVFHLGTARSRRPVLSVRSALVNRYAVAAVLVSFALQIATVAMPSLSSILDVVPLGLHEWMLVIMAAVVPAIAGQLHHSIAGRRM